MARTAFYSPAHRIANKSNFSPAAVGSDTAPSLDWGGSGIQDPRVGYNLANSATGYGALGWLGPAGSKVCSAAPAIISTTNIAVGAHPASGTAMTLRTTTGAGVTVVPAGGFVPWANYTNLIPAGALALDGLPGAVAFGTHFRTGFYDPTKGLCRCVTVTGVASGSGGAVTINGADWYGYPMKQTVTLGAGAVAVTTTKAFKFITSVVPGFTDSHNISVGTADVFGLNLAADSFGDTKILWNGVLQLLATFTAAVLTTASATTGDVRGTFTPGDASDGTKVLEIFVTPSLARVATVPQSTGLFGVPQFG